MDGKRRHRPAQPIGYDRLNARGVPDLNDSPPPVSLAAIRAPIAADLTAVDAVIRARLDSEVALIRQVAEYIVQSGGKRLRPALVLLAAGACGVTAGPHKHALAAVIEFIHTATLLHDDVVDESGLRRGRQTANALFGNAAAVLVGDFLYSRAFQMMVEVGSMPVMRVMSHATNVIAEGEVLQLMNTHDAGTTEERYFQVIRYKTAKLFEAATQVGAILGGADADLEQAMARYGMHLGVAFQLTDDILDYSGDPDATGKHVGDDLAEGKPTLPLIHAMKVGTPTQVAAIRAAIETGGLDQLDTVLETIRETGALTYAARAARREADAATRCLARLPGGAAKDSLLQLATFSVERSF